MVAGNRPIRSVETFALTLLAAGVVCLLAAIDPKTVAIEADIVYERRGVALEPGKR